MAAALVHPRAAKQFAQEMVISTGQSRLTDDISLILQKVSLAVEVTGKLNRVEMRISARKAAWRNLMVCAINAAIEQGLFTLRTHGNTKPQGYGYTGVFFDFDVGGLPAQGYVADAICHGTEAVLVRAAINPPMLMLVKGDAYASGCLMKNGECRLSSVHSFSCSNTLKAFLAELQVEARGYCI